MSTSDQVISIVETVLNISDYKLNKDSSLLGDIPEFDSQAVLAVITTIEEDFGVFFEDEEITADIFETVNTLVAFVEAKL